MTTPSKTPATLVCVTNAVLSFPALFEPKPKMKGATPDGKPVKLTYQATLCLPPEFDLKPLQAAAAAAIEKKFGKIIKVKNPFRLCSEVSWADHMPEGSHFIAAHSDRAPSLVDRRRLPTLDQELFYSGCIVNAWVNAWAWDHPTGGKGVSFDLKAVQFVAAGTRIDGRVSNDAVAERFPVLDGDDTAGLGNTGGQDLNDLFS